MADNAPLIVEKIRDRGVSFCTWTQKGSKGEFDWTSLSGSNYKKLLEKLPCKLFFSVHHNTHFKTVKLWEDFLSLNRFITHDEETKTIEFIFSKCKEWVNSFLDLGSMRQGYQNIIPYLHCLVYHIPYFVVTYGKLVNHSGQGVEKINDDIKKFINQKQTNMMLQLTH